MLSQKKKKKWKLLDRKVVYNGRPFIKISIDRVKLPNGKIISDYHRIETNNAVMLLVENKNKEVLVYNEYRHGLNNTTFSFPAGAIEDKENYKKAAIRELREETGYKADSVKLYKKYIISGSYLVSNLYYVLVKDIQKINEPVQKDMEDPDFMWLNKRQVNNAIMNNDFKCLTYASAALLWVLNAS